MSGHQFLSVCIAAIALHLGWLPHSAGAALLLDLDPAHGGESETRARLDVMLDSLSDAAGDSARFAACFDATRGILLLDDLSRGGELGPCPDLAALTGENAMTREVLIANLRSVCRNGSDPDAINAHRERDPMAAPPGPLSRLPDVSAGYSLIHCDLRRARLLAPKNRALRIDRGFKDWTPRHPLLGECLILNLLLPRDWTDSGLDVWRGYSPAQRACSFGAGLPVYDLGAWVPDRRLKSWADSVLNDDPRFADAGWLKRKLLGKGLLGLARNMRSLQGAREELTRQRTGKARAKKIEALSSSAGPPPDCGLGSQAVLRLIFLPDIARPDCWRLAMGLVSAYRCDSPLTLIQEPGFAGWFARHEKWQQDALEAMFDK